MKKLAFSEKYGMNQAVVNGRKTMARDIVPQSIFNQTDWKSVEEGNYVAVVDGDGYYHDIRRCGKYQIGEVVAVAMAYKTIYDMLEEIESTSSANDWWLDAYDKVGNGLGPSVTPGWNNKMFVRADLMPHRIRITDIKVERLQNISHEDCLKEGITTITEGKKKVGNGFGWDTMADTLERDTFLTAKAAFAALADKIGGKGTWASNPWVFAYEFELIK